MAKFSAWLFGICFLIYHFSAQSAVSGPSSNTTGKFTVSYSSAPFLHDEAKLDVLKNGNYINSYSIGTSAGSLTITVSNSGTYTIQHWSRKKGGCLLVGSNGCVEPEPGTPWIKNGEFNISVNIPKPGSISLASSNTSGSYTVSWGAASGSPTRYELQERKDGGSWATIQSTTARSKSLSGKGTGVYDYRVRACYTACSAYTSVKTITVVRTPGAINVPSSSTSGSIAISWSGVSGAASYKLQEQKSDGVWRDVYSGTSTNKTLTGRVTGTYKYRVAAVENGVIGTYKVSGSVIVSRAPAVPSGLTVPTNSSGMYTVSWNPVNGANHYILQESGAGNGSWTQQAITKSLYKLADGNYTYKVRACSIYSGVTACSGWTTGKTVKVSLPELYAESKLGSPQVNIIWKNWAVDRVTLTRNNKTVFDSGWTYNGSARHIVDTVNSSGNYNYSLHGWKCLVNGSNGGCLEPNSVGIRTTDSVNIVLKPGVPNLSVESDKSYDGIVKLFSAGDGPIDSVRWQKRRSTDSWPSDNTYNISSSYQFSVSELSDATWQFRVKNCNAAGCSDSWSNSVSVDVWNQPIPSAPEIEQLPNDDDGVFTLKWSDLKSEYVYKYEIYENGALIATLSSNSQNPNTAFTYRPTPEREDGNYNYVVKACNLRACTSSDAMSLIVAHRPDVPAEVYPSALYTRTGLINISWGSVNGNLTHYEVVSGSAESDTGPVTWDTAGTIAHTDLQTLRREFHLDDGYHAFKVRACNQVSSYSACSDYTESEIVQVSISEPPVAVDIQPHRESAPEKTSYEVLASDRVGIVNGEFEVSESGEAVYTIPIVTGPASGGSVPSLSLNYNSQNGNGPLGIGWAIGGLSSITGCRRTEEEDGENGSAFDRYCLDGQRLKVIRGQYGELGSEYRTSIDSFSRVRLIATDTDYGIGFEVYKKDGSISYYGTREDSIETNSWYLDRTVDSAGNYIEYEYLKDVSVGEQLIKRINYSGNDVDEAINTIEFFYDSDRLDKRYGYAFGVKKSLTRRLISIVSSVENIEIRRYIPIYDYSNTGRLLLTGIKECVKDNCRPATQFAYSEFSGDGFSFDTVNQNLLHSGYRGGKIGDVNGDGRADLVFIREDGDGRSYLRIALGQPNGTLALQDQQLRVRSNARREWHLIDYNDDGKDDFLHAPTSDFAEYWTVNYSVGNSFSTSEVPTSIFFEDNQKGQMYDLNADGLPDFIREITVYDMERIPGGGLRLKSTPRKLNLPPPTTSQPGPLYEKVLETVKDIAVTADFNGDGIADIDAIYSIIWRCTEDVGDAPKSCPEGQEVKHNLWGRYLSAGGNEYTLVSSFPTLLNELDDEYYANRRFADLNGDGLTDELSKSSASSTWSFRYFTGTGFSIWQTLPIESDKLQLYDWNGDGLLDILLADKSEIVRNQYYPLKVLLNKSSVFDDPLSTNYVLGASEIDHFYYTMDTSGDGRPELIGICANLDEKDNYCNEYAGTNDKYLRIFYNKHNNKPIDFLTSITNGFGVKTEIEYARLNDPSANVYTRRTGSSALEYGNGSPVRDIYSPMYVVKKVISDAPAANDDSNQVEVHYHYTGARIQGGGRGFLGFEKITTYDPQNKVKSTTTYRQDYPYIGMPVETAKVIEPDADNISTPASCSGTGLTVISCSTNTLAFVEPIVGKTKLPYISKAVDKSYDIDGHLSGEGGDPDHL